MRQMLLQDAGGRPVGQLTWMRSWVISPLHVLSDNEPLSWGPLRLRGCGGVAIALRRTAPPRVVPRSDAVIMPVDKVASGMRVASPGRCVGHPVEIEYLWPDENGKIIRITLRSSLRRQVQVFKYRYPSANGETVEIRDADVYFLSHGTPPGSSGAIVRPQGRTTVIGFIHGNAYENADAAVVLDPRALWRSLWKGES